MLTSGLLAISGILIGAGIVLLLRDWLGAQRFAFIPWAVRPVSYGHDTGGDPTEIDVVRRPRARREPARVAEPKGAPRESPHDADAARFVDQAESAAAWAASAQTVAIAVRAINGAFARADARLVPGEPDWHPVGGGHALAVSVEAAGREAGVLEVLRARSGFVVRRIPVAPGARSALPPVVVETLTVPRLAEALAAAAWACVVEARQEAS